MDQQSKTRLEEKGWKIGTATDFLELTAADLLIIEIKLALTRRLEERQQHPPSSEKASHQSSQTPSPTSIDQLIHDMIATGASPQEIGQLIANIDTAA